MNWSSQGASQYRLLRIFVGLVLLAPAIYFGVYKLIWLDLLGCSENCLSLLRFLLSLAGSLVCGVAGLGLLAGALGFGQGDDEND
ncbi:hypothetical protein M1N56_08270 [Dehalococcoidia bacterium]|nr:hypothetical protein [Dehalococcoidia bacterium]